MPVRVSHHAYERAVERCGWTGTPQTLAALIGSYEATRVGLKLGGPFTVKIYRERMAAVINDQTVITIIGDGK